MPNTRKPKLPEQYSEQETARRRDEAIRRALRTPPTTLKDMKKKRTANKVGASSSKRGGA